jgi:hypothetical protein
MPKRVTLTEKQKRILEKIGLMPLTSMREINRRTGIPMTRLELIMRPNPWQKSTKLDLIKRFKKKPKTRYLLSHPKLWQIATIMDLAKSHSTPEIRQILLQKAVELNTKRPILGIITIQRIIKNLNLRSADDFALMRRRTHSAQRPINSLSEETRKALLIAAQEILRRLRFRSTLSFTADELRDKLMERLEREVRLFDPRGIKEFERLKNKWEIFINKGLRFFIIDALRESGPLTRTRKQRRPYARSDILENVAKPSAMPVQPGIKISFKKPLTPREQEAWKLLKRGKTNKQTAIALGITATAVIYLKKGIRGKILIQESE